MSDKLKIATCQFPISKYIGQNAKYIIAKIKKAAKKKVDLIHFSECALSGYAGVDFVSFEDFDWEKLSEETSNIAKLARDLNIWIVLGSTHRENNRITNCLYLISNRGQIIDRYDKRMLTKNDIKYYSPGKPNQQFIIEIEGIKIGFLICYDSSFQEMFDCYKDKCDVILLSLYNAKNTKKSFIDEVTPSIIRTRALDNNMWILANNSCSYYSNWPTCIASPEGVIVNKLARHRSGIMYHEFPDDNYRKWKIKYHV